MGSTAHRGEELSIEDYRVLEEPYYRSTGDEIDLFEQAHELKMPVMLKGPTGSGKTRFLQHMAYRLQSAAHHGGLSRGPDRQRPGGPVPVRRQRDRLGRRSPHSGGQARRHLLPRRVGRSAQGHHRGHPSPGRRSTGILPIEKKGHIVEADDDFMLVVSFNPGYQSILKDLKQSTRQRFMALDFDYLEAEPRSRSWSGRSGVDAATATKLVELGSMIRNLRDHGLEEGVSTRLLVYAARLMVEGVAGPARRRSGDDQAADRRHRHAGHAAGTDRGGLRGMTEPAGRAGPLGTGGPAAGPGQLPDVLGQLTGEAAGFAERHARVLEPLAPEDLALWAEVAAFLTPQRVRDKRALFARTGRGPGPAPAPPGSAADDPRRRSSNCTRRSSRLTAAYVSMCRGLAAKVTDDEFREITVYALDLSRDVDLAASLLDYAPAMIARRDMAFLHGVVRRRVAGWPRPTGGRRAAISRRWGQAAHWLHQDDLPVLADLGIRVAAALAARGEGALHALPSLVASMPVAQSGGVGRPRAADHHARRRVGALHVLRLQAEPGGGGGPVPGDLVLGAFRARVGADARGVPGPAGSPCAACTTC